MLPAAKKILILLAAAALTACVQEKHEPAVSQADKAIGRGDYTAAIEILEGQLRRNTWDEGIRLELASAYAARAGLPLTKFVPLARTLVRSTRDVDRYYEQRMMDVLNQVKKHAKTRTEVDILSTLERVYSVTLRLATILRQFEAIPVIRTRGQYNDLNQAIAVLSEIPDARGGTAMYRALLRVAMLRYRLEYDTDGLKIQACQIDAPKAMKLLTLVHEDVRGVLEDLSAATLNPKRQAELAKSVNQLDEGWTKAMERLKELEKSGETELIEIPRLLYGRCKQ